MRKVLITGSNGLLGQKLIDLYAGSNEVELIATSRGANRYPATEGYTYMSLDITSEKQVFDVLKKCLPDAVINTAAMTNVDQCEDMQEECDALNVDAVKYLVEACNEIKAHFIHLSTDFIFDGEAGPYKEEDNANPLSYYGMSKWKGEQLIMDQSDNWSIARTILVYGVVADMSRSNIVLWAKGALEQGKTLNIIDDQFRMPTLAEDLAQGCFLIEKQKKNGVYNICGKDFMHIYELVQRVAKHYGLSMESVGKTNSASLNQKAKRPPRTGFDLTKSRRELGYEPRSFEEGLQILDQQLKTMPNQ